MAEKKQKEIPKAYDPSEVEDKWYKYWQDNKIFHSEIDESKEPYVIPIPPPNVTGMLTMGHILNNTLQDIFIRTKRMQGYNSCWVPGTDHASIATETKVTNYLSGQGINKYEIGREEFLKHCWEWTKEYGGIINHQLKKLGVSCDWDRERFTMDDDYYYEVIKAFVDLYKEEKIYRGYRMVNWCPASKSAISDEEVIYKNINGKLWYLKYPVVGTDTHLVVATTRPETMLGDTGVAVNPKDKRYKDVIGKKVLLPIAEREIPIFTDDYVDMEFGTGAVKVTPAHDINDKEMGQRHNLQVINIFNDDASVNVNVPKDFRGLDRFEARKKVIARFEELGLMEKIEDYQHKVGYSERGGVPIEPYLSEQWFMKMDDLVSPAIDVVREEKINFYPDHWKKTYFHWMENIKDWCISRQLWWGHRIPVWYHKETGEIYCDVEPPKNIANWKQDEDVLDTWASSWLWAHAIFRTENERKYYYPTSTLVTAPDIIFFWVARMIMAGMYFRKDIPFRDVYFTSIIRDVHGKKMSKSLGNSPDPLDVIKEYSADAIRFSVIYLAPLGQDVLFSVDKCEIGRNFANKIWNAGRFLLMNAKRIEDSDLFKDEELLHQEVKKKYSDCYSVINGNYKLFSPGYETRKNKIKEFIENDLSGYSKSALKKNKLLFISFSSTGEKVFENWKLNYSRQYIEVDEKLIEKHIDFADEWIMSHFHLTLALLNTAMDNFEVNNATKILYSFVWNDFCDWYLEMIKTRFYSDDDEVKSATLTRALNLFADMLKLVHPFMPFITEELWQLIEERKDGESISTSEYPKLNSELIKPSAESEMEMVQGIVYSIRNIRGEMNIPPSKSIDAYIKSSEVKKHQIDYIKKLAKVENIITGKDVEKPDASASAVFGNSEIYVPLKGLIDLDVEKQRIEKEINRLEGSLKGLEKKLSNKKFVNNAPADVVEKEKSKQRDWAGKLEKLKELLSNLN